MFTVSEFYQPKSLEEAYAVLVKRKNNSILGGCAFLKMGAKRIGTAIDLSLLNLNYIVENDDSIEIGATTTFREIETSLIIKNNFGNILSDSIKDIIGVQFRNSVNIGATVFSKYGFSDLNTALLSLDTEVELVNGGRMSLEIFLDSPYKKDILSKIIIKKTGRKSVYRSLRTSCSDFAVLNLAVSKLDSNYKIVIGARPMGAVIAKEASVVLKEHGENSDSILNAFNMILEEVSFGTNMRGSRDYRKAICKALLSDAVMEVSKL